MENFQSNQTENLKSDSFLVNKSNKKAWLMPIVVEISKFSILTGPNATKNDELGFPTTFPS